MSITGPGSYIPTMDEFDSHWDEVNIALGGTPATDLKLKGGYTRAEFQVLRTTLQATVTLISGKENARQLAADDRDQKKAALKARMAQFRAAVGCYLQETPYEAALPLLPGFSLAEDS